MSMKLIPSVRPLSGLNNPAAIRSGQVTSASFRGPRLSIFFVGIIESVLSDILSLKRRLLTVKPFQTPPAILPDIDLVPGIYNLGEEDPRYNPYVAGIVTLAPQTQTLTAIQIQYLRQQLAFKLSTLK